MIAISERGFDNQNHFCLEIKLISKQKWHVFYNMDYKTNSLPDQSDSTALKMYLATVFTITTLILRLSVFVNVVLVVVRTINIVKPFYRINRKALVSGINIIYRLLLL